MAPSNKAISGCCNGDDLLHGQHSGRSANRGGPLDTVVPGSVHPSVCVTRVAAAVCPNVLYSTGEERRQNTGVEERRPKIGHSNSPVGPSQFYRRLSVRSAVGTIVVVERECTLLQTRDGMFTGPPRKTRATVVVGSGQRNNLLALGSESSI